ncbi:TonB-dependent receptor plug domain-containing protein [Phenylobacterium sp.]|uniref:TonB-dependent receptor plug domain-containing protein n=1 Tax=Phenylobacterium sp. TaxID=1871053 RepID=UPI0035665DF6
MVALMAGIASNAVASDADAGGAVSEVIVTGTRVTGLKASDSPAPVQVVGGDSLKRVGQPDLIQGLAQIVPSFTAEALGGDTANLTLSARLRGLSPNDTLVLVNGKRRHPTANLHVLGGPYQGAATADLSLIPVDAIDHVEVLQDGAAAQYGTDAIAGVVNIILKNSASGGQAAATAGQYYKGDGDTGALSLNFGAPLGKDGFFNITGETRFHGFSRRGGTDARISTVSGALLNNGSGVTTATPGFPNLNNIVGDAQSTVDNVFYNAGYDFGGVQAYSFGSYGYRKASAFENYRIPNRVVASPVLGVGSSIGTPGALVFAPNGFSPREGLVETDYAFTFGLKGEAGGWLWDLSSTYGRDKNDISTLNSANRSLFIDTHTTPTEFHDGAFTTTQWTNNLDITRGFDVGMATPLNVAFGIEQRNESYEITPGDPASTYKEGGQSYPGFLRSDGGKHTRNNYAGYIDIAASPVEALKLDAAVRYEHFNDFGDTTVGKLTARYDFSPMFALRGTVASGFRAPTLAEEFYSATNVSPTSAVVQLPPNSPAAALLGFSPLKPEKSTNYSVGFVAHPIEKATVTLDAYQIEIRSRIIGSGLYLGQNGATVISQAVLNAIVAHGNVLDPTVTFVGVSLFANGADTRTQGVDLTAAYSTDLDAWGRIDWTLAANYNKTTITKQTPTPAPLAAQGALLSPTAISDLTTASPREKVSLGGVWVKDRWAVSLRETIYGESSEIVSPDGTGAPPNFTDKIGVKGITDLDVSFQITNAVRLSAGANNLFDQKTPNVIQFPPTGGLADGSNVYDAPMGFSPFGINGGYYYAKVVVTF